MVDPIFTMFAGLADIFSDADLTRTLVIALICGFIISIFFAFKSAKKKFDAQEAQEQAHTQRKKHKKH